MFVVSGPSGAGKTSLCAELRNRMPWLRMSVSHTTRAPRGGEKDGADYFFVDRGTFERMAGEDRFLEWAEVHGQLYGSSVKNLEDLAGARAVLFEVDCAGARQIRERVSDVVLVFVMTPSVKDLLGRIDRRGGLPPEDLAIRFRTARGELEQVDRFDYLVINDAFEQAVEELSSIVLAETSRRSYPVDVWKEKWAREIRQLPEDLRR